MSFLDSWRSTRTPPRKRAEAEAPADDPALREEVVGVLRDIPDASFDLVARVIRERGRKASPRVVRRLVLELRSTGASVERDG